MSTLFADYIRITGTTDYKFAQTYDPLQLDPYDAMRVILEQTIFASYLDLTKHSIRITMEIRERARKMLLSLPAELHTNDDIIDQLYIVGKKLATTLASIKDTGSTAPTVYPSEITITRNELFSIFRMDCRSQNAHDHYKCTITEDFLTIWNSYFLGTYDREKYTDGYLHECAVYIPSLDALHGRVDFMKPHDAPETVMVVNLSARALTSFQLDTSSETKTGYSSITIGDSRLFSFLHHFNMSNKTVDEFMAIVASFHVMRYNNMSYKNEVTTTSLLYTLVTRSSDIEDFKDAYFDDKSAFVNILKDMVLNNQLQLGPLELFGEYLRNSGEADVAGFFNTDQVTSGMAKLFRTSIYAEFIPNKVVASMEALDEEDPDSTEEDTDLEGDTGELDNDMSDDDLSLDNNAEETEPQTVDPSKMLLQFAQKPDELSDYLFRDSISRLIGSVLKNPPENMAPNDLFFLRRWKSSWLFLVSTACLRDFLTRITRLSKN